MEFAIIANVPTPYRTHLHRRVAAELEGVRLHSLFTHPRADFAWSDTLPEEIRPVLLYEAGEGTQGEVAVGGRLTRWRREREKGRRIIAYLQQHDVRAVMVNGYASSAMRATLAWCKASGVPAFLRGDSNIAGDASRGVLRDAAKRWVVGRAIEQAQRSGGGVMPMGTLGQAYFEKYGADPERCFWVPYEPDYELFSRAEPDALQAFGEKYGLGSDRRRLLYSGRLVEVKRVDLLLDAFAAVADDRPEWDLAIAGDGPLRADLEARVPQRLRGRVRWLGFLEVDEMRLAYHACDALCLPSDYEPWALVVNEAMAAGLPVVASSVVGAARELVEEGVSGRLFEAGSLASLTEALKQITEPLELRACREGVAVALASWRRRADPVAGIRAALASVGLGDGGGGGGGGGDSSGR